MSLTLTRVADGTGLYKDSTGWTSSDMTMIAWARTSDRTVTQQDVLRLSYLTTAIKESSAQLTFLYSATPTYRAGRLSIIDAAGTESNVSPAYDISSNTWYLIAARWTVSGSTLTGNGNLMYGTFGSAPTLVTSATGSENPTWPANFQIGFSKRNNTTYAFGGQIAEVAIYNKYLTDDELKDHWLYYANSAAEKNSITGNMLAYWPLYDGKAADTTYGANIALTNQGTPSYDTAVHPTLTTYSGASAAVSKLALLGVG